MDQRNMVLIDIQGFKITNNKFIPKDLPILKNNKMAHYVFAPPFPSTLLPDDVQYQIKWLSKNHHCIKWDTGFVPHWKFQQILKKVISDGDSVHVKGKEKAKFIEKCIKMPVIELPETPRLESSKPMCLFHISENCYCSMQIVTMLYNKLKQ
jgi:hypothetical protein